MSSPVAQTEEYESNASIESRPSDHRLANVSSSNTGIISPAYPTCFTCTERTAVVIRKAVLSVPLLPTGWPV